MFKIMFVRYHDKWNRIRFSPPRAEYIYLVEGQCVILINTLTYPQAHPDVDIYIVLVKVVGL